MSRVVSEYQRDARHYYGLLRKVHSDAFTSLERQQEEINNDRYVSEGNPAIRNLNTFIEFLHRQLGDGPEISGVDFGCGSHFFVDLVRRKYGWNAIGVDPDEVAIAEAKAKYPQSREAYLINNPLEREIPLPEASQDFVFCNAVLQHFSDEETAIALGEMARLLKKEGICLVIFKRNVDDWSTLSSEKGLKVIVKDHASGKVLIEDQTMKKALAKLAPATLAKLPDHFRSGMRLFHVFDVDELCRLAARHGLQVVDSVRRADGSEATGIFLYLSGKGIPNAAIFLTKPD